MADFTLRIKKFLGKNIKADPADMDTHECQDCDGFDVSVKPGALIKRKGFTDQASVILPAAYPGSWTIKNFFQFRVTKPSAQNIFIVHAQVSGEDRIYVDYTYDGSAWVQGWVELTENEEELIADASTSTTEVYDDALSSSTNDYYKGWFLVNFTRNKVAAISAYDGAAKKLTLAVAIAAQAVNDSYSIYRFPLITQIHGSFSSDDGSSPTQTIDKNDFSTTYYELPDDFDDAYTGWVINNASVPDTQTITDYEGSYAGNQRRIVHAAIATATDGNTYWLYDKTRTLSVDDKIQFRQRPNACIMSLGNTSTYPKQFALWYGYIRKNYYFGQTGASINAGYYLEPAPLDMPGDFVVQQVTQQVSGSDFLSSGTYYYACAFIYDGYQVGPLTSAKSAQGSATASNGSQWHQVTIRIPWESGSASWAAGLHHWFISKRVTAVELYMSNDFDVEKGAGAWYRIVTIPIRQDFDYGYGGTRPVYQNGLNLKNYVYGGKTLPAAMGIIGAIITEQGRLEETLSLQNLKFEWTGSDHYSLTVNIFGTTWTNKGFPYTVVSGGNKGEIINYAVGDGTNNHSVVGKLFSGAPENSLIAFSPLKIDGTPSPDYFPSVMANDMARNGITSITDIKIVGDKVYVIGSTKSLRMAMNSARVPTFRVDAEFEYLGSEAVNGTLKIRDGIITVTKKGVYFLDNIEHYMSAQIEDTSSFPLGMTTMSEAYIGFNGQTNDIYIVFPTDSKLFSYNLNTKQWVVHSLGTAIKALTTGEDGEIYGASAGKIFRLDNGTTDDSTTISPTWKSKVYTMDAPDMEKVLNWVEITYRSDSAIQFDVFLNRSASVASWAVATDNQLAAATTGTTSRLLFPSTFRGFEFEFKFSLPAGASNTYFEVHELNVKGTVEERIS